MIDIVTRDQWAARPARRRNTITTPTPELWLHHTAGNHFGYQGMRAIQDFHMDDRGWSDIAYSYVIDPSTFAVLEGRGAGVAGGHTKGHNTISHAICVMGNYEKTRPSTALLERIAELVAYGHNQGWWPDQITGGHRDVGSTACPGQWLHQAIPAINSLATNGGTTVPTAPLANDLVAKLQEGLTAAGYQPGPADGIYGPRTHAAAIESLNDNDEPTELDETIIAKAALLDDGMAWLTQAQEATQ